MSQCCFRLSVFARSTRILNRHCRPLTTPLAVVAWLMFIANSPCFGQSSSTSSEPPLLQFSVSNLVLSQTGSTDKSNLEKLCDGDRVLKWSGTPVANNRELVAAWLACHGKESVTVDIERQLGNGDAVEQKQLQVNYRLLYASRIFAACTAGGRTDYLDPDSLFSQLKSTGPSSLETAVADVLGDEKDQVLEDLGQAFKRLTDTVKGFYRTNAITFLLNRPLEAPEWGQHVSDQFAEANSLSSLVQLSTASVWTDGDEVPALDESEVPKPASWSELCDYLSKEVELIGEHYRAATAGLTATERKQWNDWCRTLRPIWKGDPKWEEFSAGFQLTKKLDRKALVLAWKRTARLADHLRPGGNLHQALEVLKEAPPQQLQQGMVTIGNDEDSEHDQFSPITIELGGDDQYFFPESGLDPELPIRMIVDLDGDDTYAAEQNGVAAGVAGVSVLVDLRGNDRYESNQNGIGFAVCGLGLLDDAEGVDLYSGRECVQGTACVGVGIVVDRAGNDIFDAGHYSQGVGLPGGCGAVIDFEGDDHYRCTGKHASLYGDVGEFNGMGQGCGFGFRYLGFGGIGILQDRSGRDFYRAGQFGLGCGYFFGTGMVNDRGGDDVYECSRYGLGTAAHYAAGLVIDNGGDDVYLATRRAAVAELGSAWDLSLGMLVDGGGNDLYRCQSYALGGAAQNSFGIFWDKSGNDQYLTSPNPGAAGGYIGGAQYGAGRGAENLAIFLDEAGDDFYADQKTNQAHGRHEKYGIWIDR